MTTFDTQLLSREEIAAGTFAFHFAKPAGFSFKPGQAIDLVLELPDTQGKNVRHAFSLVSAPIQNELVIATRMRNSSYKRALGELPIGKTVGIERPFGSLALHSDFTRPAIFLAGGIGITPFMSMLRQAIEDGAPRDLVLIYANKRPEDAAFLNELQVMSKKLAKFRLVATMTDIGRSNRQWDGHVGSISESLIASVVNRDASPVYYLVGPPGLVEAMRDTLNQMGVADDDIRSEEFYGY